jgi:hypothetical protein
MIIGVVPYDLEYPTSITYRFEEDWDRDGELLLRKLEKQLRKLEDLVDYIQLNVEDETFDVRWQQ